MGHCAFLVEFCTFSVEKCALLVEQCAFLATSLVGKIPSVARLESAPVRKGKPKIVNSVFGQSNTHSQRSAEWHEEQEESARHKRTQASQKSSSRSKDTAEMSTAQLHEEQKHPVARTRSSLSRTFGHRSSHAPACGSSLGMCCTFAHLNVFHRPLLDVLDPFPSFCSTPPPHNTDLTAYDGNQEIPPAPLRSEEEGSAGA